MVLQLEEIIWFNVLVPQARDGPVVWHVRPCVPRPRLSLTPVCSSPLNVQPLHVFLALTGRPCPTILRRGTVTEQNSSSLAFHLRRFSWNRAKSRGPSLWAECWRPLLSPLPQNSYVRIRIPSVMILGGGAFGGVIRS